MGTPGNLMLVARDGDLAPGTGLPFQTIFSVSMNDAGAVVFGADLDPVLFSSTDTGIWTNERGSLELIARTGDIAPGTEGGVFRPNHPLGSPSINAAGTVVFEANLLTSESHAGRGLWRWRAGELTAIATTFQPFEVGPSDVRIVHTVDFDPVTSASGTGGIHGQNASGQIVFQAIFQEFPGAPLTRGLFVAGGGEGSGPPPDCSTAAPSLTELWPPDHGMVPVEILGVIDEDGGTEIELEITGVTSDEPTNGPGAPHDPDALIVGDGTVLLRAERFGGGNGRVYEIHFTATNEGGECTGSVQVWVPHARSEDRAVDDGLLHDATLAD